MTRRIVWLIVAVTGLALVAWPAIAQQTTPPAEPPKQEEVPFWAIGRPQAGPGAQMAPVPAFPIPTPADKLPLAKMKVPPGFKSGARLGYGGAMSQELAGLSDQDLMDLANFLSHLGGKF
jgi:hypothetical protein